MRSWVVVAVATALAAPASAQVVLTPGQGVTVTVSANGTVVPEKTHPDALTPGDLEAVGLVQKSYAVDKTIANAPAGTVLPPIAMTASPGQFTPIVPGRIELTFVVTGGHTVLAIRNGYDRGLTYRATIMGSGRTAPTDVCLVMPGKRGYEHWPYEIDKIELTAISLADWSPEDGVPCK